VPGDALRLDDEQCQGYCHEEKAWTKTGADCHAVGAQGIDLELWSECWNKSHSIEYVFPAS
jgi:hypothetical protein